MQTATSTTEILNDLVLINNDRIAGYEKALEELQSKNDSANSDLHVMFQRFIDESRDFRNELGREVQVLGDDMAEGTMTSGKLYRVWMDVKALFSGKDRHAILSSCEGGEDAALEAYEKALDQEGLPEFLRELINDQKEILQEAQDDVKMLRDQSK